MTSPSGFTIIKLMSWHNLKVILYPLPFCTKEMHTLARNVLIHCIWTNKKIYFFQPHLYTVHLALKLVWTSEIRHKGFLFEQIYLEMTTLPEDNYCNIRCWFSWMWCSTPSCIFYWSSQAWPWCFMLFWLWMNLKEMQDIFHKGKNCSAQLSQNNFIPQFNHMFCADCLFGYCYQPWKWPHFSGEMIPV